MESHVRTGHPKFPETPEGPFVTISREAGAGAGRLAGLLADRLNRETDTHCEWVVFGANLIEAMLRANRLSADMAAFLPEGRVSEINALIGEIMGMHPNLWELVQKTKELTRQLARKGGAIFVGRGAAFSTAGVANGVHVRLVAPTEFRAQATAERLNLSLEAAVAHNAREDAARRAYVKANFEAYGPDPKAYDYVINTGRVSLEEAAGLIISAMHHRRTAQTKIPAKGPEDHGQV